MNIGEAQLTEKEIGTMVPCEYIERKLNVEFDPRTRDYVNRAVNMVTFRAGDTVVWEGDLASDLYFLVEGVVRGYYIDARGNDVTKCFCAENEFFSTEGFRTSLPATFTIECLENCQCLKLPYAMLRRMVGSDKVIGEAVRYLFQTEVSRQEGRNKGLMLLDAEERYLEFRRDYPDLCDRVALKFIASYIGVRAASLSRIRKKQRGEELT